MAKVYGYYAGAPGQPATPTRIGVTATPAESERLNDLPQAAAPIIGSPERIYHAFPADRKTVGEIARRVEVDCDDPRLID